MPTLITCAAASLALVVAVGLQAPATSVGLRWKPGPRGRTLELIPVEIDEIDLAFNTRPDRGWPSWMVWLLAILAAAAILYAGARWIRHFLGRPPAMSVVRTGADLGVASEADARILQSGLVAAIQILSSERSSTDAVIQAWQGLQDAAAAAGVTRRPAETTSEFTARILYRSRSSAQPIAVLLALYQRVRFGEHSPTAEEIAAARNSLVTLVEIWQAELPERRLTRVAR